MDKELKFLVDNGMIDLDDVRSMIEMNERKEKLAKFGKSPKQYTSGVYEGQWYIKIPDPTKKGKVQDARKTVRKATKKECEDVILEYLAQFEDNPTIEDLFTEWNDRRLELKKIGKSSHTRHIQCFKRHYSEFGKQRIKELKGEDIVDFLEEQIPLHNLSSKAFALLKSITKGTLKYAKKKKYIIWSPETVLADLDVSDTQFAKTIKEDYEEVFNEEETAKMLSYCTTNLNMRSAAVVLMFVSGVRVGEVVTIKHEDINYFNNTVFVRRTETRYKVNGKDVYDVNEYPKTKNGVRKVVVPSSYKWLLRYLFENSKEHDYVFTENGKRLTTLLIRKQTYKICKKVGVYKKSPHKIRATYDTILLDSGVDKRTVKDQMGHADIAVSEKNYHRNRKSIETKQGIIDAIPEFQAI